MGLGPESAIHFLEESARFGVPAPPKIVGQVLQAGDPRGKAPVVKRVGGHNEGHSTFSPGERPGLDVVERWVYPLAMGENGPQLVLLARLSEASLWNDAVRRHETDAW